MLMFPPSTSTIDVADHATTTTTTTTIRKEMFYLTTHSTHFIYGYMVSDIW